MFNGQVFNYQMNFIPYIFSTIYSKIKMSLIMRNPDFCICENKDADQLRGKREADQRLFSLYG